MSEEQVIYTHGDPLDAAERWIEIVKQARHLMPTQFQTWLKLVGDGNDNVRCFKGEQFLRMFKDKGIGTPRYDWEIRGNNP